MSRTVTCAFLAHGQQQLGSIVLDANIPKAFWEDVVFIVYAKQDFINILLRTMNSLNIHSDEFVELAKVLAKIVENSAFRTAESVFIDWN